MTIIGLILLLVGGAASMLILTDNRPEILLTMPFREWEWVWFLVALGGAVLMYLNRRPSN